MTLTPEQISRAARYAEELAKAGRSYSVLMDIDDSEREVAILRAHYLRNFSEHFHDLAAECGYVLVPKDGAAGEIRE